MRVQIRVGVFHEGRALMPPEIHDLPVGFAKSLLAEGRAVPAPDEIQGAEPVAEQREPVKRVRRQ
jgi:hypothetical protein